MFVSWEEEFGRAKAAEGVDEEGVDRLSRMDMVLGLGQMGSYLLWVGWAQTRP